MTEKESLATALTPEILQELTGMPVVDVKWRYHNNWLGERSLRIWVILDESTTTNPPGWPALKPINDAIHDRLDAAGVDLFPYASYGTMSELQEAGVKV